MSMIGPVQSRYREAVQYLVLSVAPINARHLTCCYCSDPKRFAFIAFTQSVGCQDDIEPVETLLH